MILYVYGNGSTSTNLFFHLINELQSIFHYINFEQRVLGEWGELLGDPAITAAILDRIIHRAEVIQLGGDSHRLKNRSTIFGDKAVQN